MSSNSHGVDGDRDNGDNHFNGYGYGNDGSRTASMAKLMSSNSHGVDGYRDNGEDNGDDLFDGYRYGV
eukprot:6182115-Ditylum_brightwellii.AAC.1